MWFVMMFFIYGVKGVWLLWVWPLFTVIFRMIYLGNLGPAVQRAHRGGVDAHTLRAGPRARSWPI